MARPARTATVDLPDTAWARPVELVAILMLLPVLSLPAAVATRHVVLLLPGIEPIGTYDSLIALVFVPLSALSALVLVMPFLAASQPVRPSPTLGQVPLALVAWVREAWLFLIRALGLRCRPRALLEGAAAGLLALGAAVATTPFIQSVGSDARDDVSAAASTPVRMLWGAVIAPLPEELAYRGPLLVLAALLGAWGVSATARRWSMAAAVLASTAVFGLMHLGWSAANAVHASVSGLAFAGIALRHRSLWPAVIAHAVYNMLVSTS